MQTTRGASLSGEAKGPTGSRRYISLFATVAIVAWGIDQITKAVAVATLSDRGPVTIVPHVFDLLLTRNAGAAFSMGTGLTAVLSIVAVAVVIFVVRTARRLRDPGWAAGLGFLLGGAAGNLTDRIFREPSILQGHVVDFLHLHHWPIFNCADLAITAAAIIILVRSWQGVSLDGSR